MRSLLDQEMWEELEKHKSDIVAGDYKFIERISIGDRLFANAILELLISAKVDVTRNLTGIPSGWFKGTVFYPKLWNYRGVDINSILSNRKIQDIGDSCFSIIRNTGSDELIIESHIDTIGESSFSYLSDVSGVRFEEGLRKIGPWCFRHCQLDHADIILPSSIKYVGGYCFSDSHIRSIYIPRGVEIMTGDVGDDTTTIEYGGSRDELAEVFSKGTTLKIEEFELYHRGNVVYNVQP